MNDAIFLIEDGKALELVRKHIQERDRVLKQALVLSKELGVTQVWTSIDNGVLVSVQFPDAVHADFTKPRDHGSKPKRGTEWAKKFAAQVGYENPSNLIMDAFNIPCTIGYGEDGKMGFTRIGMPYLECGFLYLGEDGPYAMWVPDFEEKVQADIAAGQIVAEPARSFRMQFEGCRRITQAEWDLMVEESEPKQKAAEAARAATPIAA
jgi:hypothetical protein